MRKTSKHKKGPHPTMTTRTQEQGPPPKSSWWASAEPGGFTERARKERSTRRTKAQQGPSTTWSENEV